jgi:tetratricopeptide (TPR) repeat protein
MIVRGILMTFIFGALAASAGEPAPPARQKIALLFLEDRTEGPALAHWCKTFHRLLFDGLRGVPAAHVLERNAVQYAFFRLGLKPGAGISDDKAREASEILDVDRVIYGEIRKDGERWAVALRLLEPAGDRAVREISAAGNNLFDLRDGLVRNLLAEMRIEPHPDGKAARRWTSDPKALESLSKFYAADDEADAGDSEHELREAVDRDFESSRAHAWLASVLLKRGSLDEALREIGLASRIDPDQAIHHHILGEILAKIGNLPDAESEYREAHRLDPDSVRILAGLARILQKEKKLQEAIEAFEQGLRIDPTDLACRTALALTLRLQGDAVRSAAELRNAEIYSTETASAELGLFTGFYILDDATSALDHYEKYIRAAGRAKGGKLDSKAVEHASKLSARRTPQAVPAAAPRAYTPEGFEAAIAERLTVEEARKVIDPLAISPELREFTRRKTEGTATDLEKARALFQELLLRLPGHGEKVARTAAEAFAAWDQPDQAFCCQDYARLYVAMAREAGLQAFLAEVTRDAEGKFVLHVCGSVIVDGATYLVDPAFHWFGIPHRKFKLMDDVQAAAEYLDCADRDHEIAAKLSPSSSFGQVCLAHACLDRKDRVGALAAIERAEELEPGRGDIYKARARLSSLDRNYERCVWYLRRSLEISGEDAKVHQLLAQVLRKQGKYREAVQEYELILAHGPGAEVHKRILREIRHTRDLEQGYQELGRLGSRLEEFARRYILRGIGYRSPSDGDESGLDRP